MKNMAKGKQRGWDVVLDGEVVDTVYFESDMAQSDIKRSLINHDGYDASIQLRPTKKATTTTKTANIDIINGIINGASEVTHFANELGMRHNDKDLAELDKAIQDIIAYRKQYGRSMSASVRTALHAKSNPKIEKDMDTIEELINKIENAKNDTYLWRMWRNLRNEYKLSRIPQLKEYIGKKFLISQDSKENPVLRKLDLLELALEDAGVETESLAQDKERLAKGRNVVAFLDRLARAEDAPLRQIVAQLNALDLRKEADAVATFAKQSKAITDVVRRVVLGE